MISLISSLSLKLYLNSLVYLWNIFGSSSKVFGNIRKFSENVRERSPGLRTILENLRISSEGGRKSSENHQKRRHQHVYIIKRTLHGGLKIWILFSRGKNNILLTRCARSQNIVLPLENKIHIFAPPSNILYLSQVTFEGVVGKGDSGDIAIDDFSLTAGSCAYGR